MLRLSALHTARLMFPSHHLCTRLAIAAVALISVACSDTVTQLGERAGPSVIREVLRNDATADCANCIIGPVTLTRTTADPQVVTYTFLGDPAADYVIDISDNGSRGLTGSVKLNGADLVTPAMLGGDGAFSLHQPVSVSTNNTLEIRLAGKPGATMSVNLVSGVKMIGPEGGTIRSPHGTAVLTVPPGALANQTELSVAVGGGLPAGADPEIALAAPVVTLGPSGTTFAAPVTLSVRPTISVADIRDLSLHQFLPVTGDLRYLNDRVDPGTGSVSIETRHFSIFWLLRLRKRVEIGVATKWSLVEYPTSVSAAGGDKIVELEANIERAARQWTAALEGADVSFSKDAVSPTVRFRALTRQQADDEFLEDPLTAPDGGPAEAAVMTNVFTRATQVILNDEETWTTSESMAAQGVTSAAHPFEFVVLHELGHVLGLRHNGISDPPVMAERRLTSLPSPLRCEDVGDVRKTYHLDPLAGLCADTALSFTPSITVAGTPASPAPRVQVLDQHGNPIAHVPVLFIVPSGSAGNVMGGLQYTDANGNASPTAWVMGEVGSSNTLWAFVGYLGVNATPLRLTFSVTAAPEPLPSDTFCGLTQDFGSPTLPPEWTIVTRRRGFGSPSTSTGIVNGRLQAASTDNDAIVGRLGSIPPNTEGITIEFEGNVPLASSGTGHQLYILAGGKTVFVAAGYSTTPVNRGFNWYVDLYSAEGTSPATSLSTFLGNTPFTRLGHATFDNVTSEPTYQIRAVLSDGQIEWDIRRLPGLSPVATRIDLLPGFEVNEVRGLFYQVYHTSPGLLWGDNLRVTCH